MPSSNTVGRTSLSIKDIHIKKTSILRTQLLVTIQCLLYYSTSVIRTSPCYVQLLRSLQVHYREVSLYMIVIQPHYLLLLLLSLLLLLQYVIILVLIEAIVTVVLNNVSVVCSGQRIHSKQSLESVRVTVVCGL